MRKTPKTTTTTKKPEPEGSNNYLVVGFMKLLIR